MRPYTHSSLILLKPDPSQGQIPSFQLSIPPRNTTNAESYEITVNHSENNEITMNTSSNRKECPFHDIIKFS